LREYRELFCPWPALRGRKPDVAEFASQPVGDRIRLCLRSVTPATDGMRIHSESRSSYSNAWASRYPLTSLSPCMPCSCLVRAYVILWTFFAFLFGSGHDIVP
jgi:hypothetical protein